MSSPTNHQSSQDPCHGVVNHGNYEKCPVQPDSQAGDDQPTLRYIKMTVAFTQRQIDDMVAGEDIELQLTDEAIAAIRLLVEGAAPKRRNSASKTEYNVKELSGYTEAGEPIYWPIKQRTTVDANADAWNDAIDQYTENLRGRLGHADNNQKESV